MPHQSHPSPSDGGKASYNDNVNGYDCFERSKLPDQLQSLEPQKPPSTDSQQLQRNECRQAFLAEALDRSRKNGDPRPRLAEKSEPQPSTSLPSEDSQANTASGGTTSGLDLLGSLALTKPPAEPSSSSADEGKPLGKTVKEWVALETAAKMKKEERIYVDKVLEWDVLCGRGGKSNHWSGNKRYRQVVSEMKAMYKHQDDKSAKTDLSRAIVDYVCNYGGRFLKKEGFSDRYYVLTRAEARKKTSQALRETKEPKWTL